MFKNMSIKCRIYLTLALMVIMIITVGVYGKYNTGKIVHTLQDVSLHDSKIALDIQKIETSMETNRSLILLSLQHHPEFAYAKLHNHPVGLHLDAIEKNIAKTNAIWSAYLSDIKSPEERRLAQQWHDESESFGSINILAASAYIREQNWKAAELLLLGKIKDNYLSSTLNAKKITDHLDKVVHENDIAVKNDIKTTDILTVGALVIASFIAILFGTLLIRSITVPLYIAVEAAKAVAKGDLTNDIQINSTNELGQLLLALRDMEEHLTGAVSKVRSSSDTIATASSEIASGNMDLSSRTEQQASSLEETASSIEELTSTVRQNAENSRHANQLASQASDVAIKGGEVVSEVVNTMQEINDSSKKVSDIISVIDGIAFQTNILALNAAVEAARAGEQGRGFAVVATEVRSLAQRSAAAAREIKDLIDNSVEKVTEGSKLVETAGSTMKDIVSSIKNVNDIVSEITVASQEQSEGIEQVNQAITQMDHVTQQNAALVEEAAAAAQSLQEQTLVLTDAVSVFKIKENHTIHTPFQAKIAHEIAPTHNEKIELKKKSSTKLALAPVSKHIDDNWEEF